jgi:Flp pilus assembly protein TadG
MNSRSFVLATLRHRRHGGRERGVIAIIVALSLAVLIGFGGLVLDLGHLFVNKTELQNAADACALAAANQLVCDTNAGACPTAFLQDAEAAGIYVAGRNTSDFQKKVVAIDAQDVKFNTAIGPNASYLSRADGASANSKFAMCNTRSAAIPTWLMQVLKTFQPTNVSAQAVATLAPGQTACNASPIGVCSIDKTLPGYGYTTGQWITARFNHGQNGDDSLSGNFRWVDFTPSAGGTNEVRDQLLGNGTVCGIAVGDNVREEGVKQGAKSAWNTRFGINPPGGTDIVPLEVVPDKTGFSYPSKTPPIPVGTSAYANYRLQQAVASPFDDKLYIGDKVNGKPISSADHLAYGGERRLISVPVIECGKAPAEVKILDMACVLMLNPMSNGATGDIYLEWRGLSNVAGSACRTAGVPGGTTGPLVPTLVQ